jgi:hypothetical protein
MPVTNQSPNIIEKSNQNPGLSTKNQLRGA